MHGLAMFKDRHVFRYALDLWPQLVRQYEIGVFRGKRARL